MPPSAIKLLLFFKVNKLNFTIPRNFLDLAILNIGEIKISLQPCLSLTFISFRLWAEPIILKFLGREKEPVIFNFLLKEGI